jgi:hypothetical protein
MLVCQRQRSLTHNLNITMLRCVTSGSEAWYCAQMLSIAALVLRAAVASSFIGLL